MPTGAQLDDTVQDLTLKVGVRVRRLRKEQSLTRAQLSEKSGISARYLAQLETGAGNISIGLLQRVAVALAVPIECLVAQHDPWESDFMQFAAMFGQASADSRAQALTLLKSATQPSLKVNRICLIGLRGAGKSSLGQALAQAHDLSFVELNQVVERNAGIPINEIMGLYGAEGYRAYEADALAEVAKRKEGLVLAVAGGIVATPATFKTVLDQFHTIWIKADPEDHMARVIAQGDMRPMANNPAAMSQLRSILAQRAPDYAKASAVLETTGKPFDASFQELDELVRARGFLQVVDARPD